MINKSSPRAAPLLLAALMAIATILGVIVGVVSHLLLEAALYVHRFLEGVVIVGGRDATFVDGGHKTAVGIMEKLWLGMADIAYLLARLLIPLAWVGGAMGVLSAPYDQHPTRPWRVLPIALGLASCTLALNYFPYRSLACNDIASYLDHLVASGFIHATSRLYLGGVAAMGTLGFGGYIAILGLRRRRASLGTPKPANLLVRSNANDHP